MRIFNQEKTEELNDIDFSKGYLVDDSIVIHIPEQQEVVEQFHYETVREYPNGGKDVKKVIDVEGKPYIAEHDETENIQVYITYTEQELQKIENEKTILQLKQNLANTDYQAIKYAEGRMTEEEYAPIGEQRQQWRDEINRLE